MSKQEDQFNAKEVARETIKNLEERRDTKGGVTGIPTGFTALDRVTAGWQDTELIVLASAASLGKTSFILSIVRNAAIDFGKRILLFTPRTNKIILTNRLISAEAELESEKIKKGQLANWEWEKLYVKIASIAEATIQFDDTPKLFIEDIVAKSHKYKNAKGLDFIVIDDLQFIRIKNAYPVASNREQELAYIVRELKTLACETGVPVLVTSQLNRNINYRGGDMTPQLSDLRDSGSIEDFADMVLFLYRAEYYGITEDASGNPTAGIGEVMIAKNLNGSLADIPLRFIGKYTKFDNLENDTFGMGDLGGGFPSAFDMTGDAITLGSKVKREGGGEYGSDNDPFSPTSEFDMSKAIALGSKASKSRKVHEGIQKLIYLILLPGEVCDEPSYPSEWYAHTKQYVALINYYGEREWLSDKGYTEEDDDSARLVYEDESMPKELSVGSIIEIRHTSGERFIYRKELDNWYKLGDSLNKLINKGRAYVEKLCLSINGKITISKEQKLLIESQGVFVKDSEFIVTGDRSLANNGFPPPASPDDEPPF